MPRLPHMSLVAPAIPLLLLAALASAAGAADPLAKKPGMRFRYANKESQWLDRYAETHEPLGAGPLRMRPATEEESKWLNRISSDDTTAEGPSGSHDGEGGGGRYIEFDEDNPYVEAVQAWAARLGLEKARAEDL